MDDADTVLAYAQNRLGPEARAAFEAELAQRRDLAAELEVLTDAGRAAGGPIPDQAARDAGWARLSAALEAERAPANTNRRPSMLQAAAIAALAIGTWQLIAVPNLPVTGGAYLEPASDSAVGDVALRVAFADAAPLSAVTAILTSTGARVVDGPTALGFFTLTFPDPAARDAAEAAFAAAPELVMTVTRP